MTSIITDWLNSTTRPIDPADILPVLDHITNHYSTDLVTTASALKALADLCRDPPTRQSLAQKTPLISVCCQVLCKLQQDKGSQAEEILVLVQLLRCICNSCADNDVGRDQLLSSGGIEQLAKVLVQVDEVKRQPVPVGQATMGAVLNVCLDHKGCTEAMAQIDGVIDKHLQLLNPSNEEMYVIWPLVCSSLDNLCECEQAIKQFEQTPDLALTVLSFLYQFCQILSTNKDFDEMKGAQRTLLWVLCETAEKSAVVRQQLCQPALVLPVFDILEFYLTHGPELIESEEEGEENEEEEGEPAAMPPNKPIPQNTNRWADAVCQLIVAISGEDTALTSLFEDPEVMSRLVTILQSDNQGEGMAAAALLCLGNLCRTDQHCTQLVQQHPQMIQMLVDRWFGQRQTNVRTRHAASGVLKNLCLAPANRPIMLELGLNRVAADNLETAVVPIQANSIGILRHLANGQDHQVVSQTIMGLIQGDDCALTKLLNVVKGTDIDGIRCEGTRLIATVAKRVYLERDGNVVGNAQEILQPEGKFDLVTPLVRLVALDGQRHPLLQQESLVALTVLAATQRFSPDIVRMLAEPVPIPSGKEDGEENRSQTFCQILKSLIQNQQSNGSWPQAALQAQSLAKQLSAMNIDDPLLNELTML